MKLKNCHCLLIIVSIFLDEGPKFDFIEQITNDDCDVLFLQEHWLCEKEFLKLAKVNGGMGLSAKSSMSESQPHDGRPYGGCMILWKPTMPNITPVDCKHTRLCAINIKVNDGVNILVMCVYMPYDNR